MSKGSEPSIKKNFIMNAILNISGFIFPLISFPYVSRVLGPAGTGNVSFAISFVTYFDMFAQLGIPAYGVRACAKVRDDKKELNRTVTELLTINLATSLIVYIILYSLIFAVPSLRKDKLIYIICSLMIILNTIGMNWLFQALEKYTYITVRSMLFKLISIVGMLLLINSTDDYIIYAALCVFSGWASNVLNLIYARRLVSLETDHSRLDYTRHFKAVGVFFAMTCATTVYLNLDNVMLGIISDKTEVGYYSAAVRIKTLLVSFITSLGGVLLPRLSYYIENKNTFEFKRLSGKALHFVILAALPLVIYFILFASPVILLLAGTQYEGSILPMQIIMPTLLLIGITNMLGIQILVPLDLEKYVLYSEIGGAIIDLILNAVFIPLYGAAGAALGTLAAEAVVLVIQYRKLKQIGYLPSSGIRMPLLVFVAFLSGAVSLLAWIPGFMNRFPLEIGCFLTILISGILYFGTYFACLFFEKDSIVLEIISQLINRFTSVRHPGP